MLLVVTFVHNANKLSPSHLWCSIALPERFCSCASALSVQRTFLLDSKLDGTEDEGEPNRRPTRQERSL